MLNVRKWIDWRNGFLEIEFRWLELGTTVMVEV